MKGVTIITDLHYRDKNTKTQPMLISRQDELIEKIINIVKDNRKLYSEHYVVFAGDEIDRTLSDLQQSKFCMFIFELNSLCDGIYAVVGNHNLTYKLKGNVFWNLCYGECVNPGVKFPTIKKVFRCDNQFKIDNVVFKLWHYSQQLHKLDLEESDELVLIGHNNVSFPGMKEVYNSLGVDIMEEYVKYTPFPSLDINFDKLRYVFLGHMHSMTGRFKLNHDFGSCVVEYLGSLGRTKSPEYKISNLRNLPTVEIDGGIVSVRDNIIELSDSEDLDETEIAIQKEIYEKGKFIKEIRSTTFSKTNVMRDIEFLYNPCQEKSELLLKAQGKIQDTLTEKAISFLNEVSLYD